MPLAYRLFFVSTSGRIDMKYVLRLDEITMDHLALVGGKAARLGELTRAGFPVPAGFCVTNKAFEFSCQSSNALATACP
jgi:phosphoenolpyruvate synthase/pyruvate phosphate dikinase